MSCIPTCVVPDLRIDTSDYIEELLGLKWSTSLAFSHLQKPNIRSRPFIIARETESGQLATIVLAGIGFVSCYYSIGIGLTITLLELE